MHFLEIHDKCSSIEMSLPQTPPSENPKESLGDPEGQSLHIENSAEIRRQHGDDGTVVMFQHVGVGSELGDRLLIPRPTDDPNDPLASSSSFP